jgi:hypothetical protein
VGDEWQSYQIYFGIAAIHYIIDPGRLDMTRWEKAGIVENRFEGDRVKQSLEEAGIPFMIKSFHDTAYDGLFIPQKGWAAVLVPGEYVASAEKLILEVKATFKEEAGDEPDEPGRDLEICDSQGGGCGSILPDGGGPLQSGGEEDV